MQTKGSAASTRAARQDEVLLTARDRMILARLAQLRLLSYAQLHEHFFATASIEATGQRMRRLARAGWVTLWSETTVNGGRPAYVLPTHRGLHIGLDEALAGVRDARTSLLVRAMLPAARRRPLRLKDGDHPPFLAHQREVNTLALRFLSVHGSAVRWASSWDKPLHARVNGVPLPQPDLVLVLEASGDLRLVFVEHDRGHESLAHFRSAKIERYADLAARPQLLESLTGFREFVVRTSVLDARFRRPMRRLQALARATLDLGADHLFRFSLAGRLAASPAGSVWLEPEFAAERESEDRVWNDGGEARSLADGFGA